MASLIFLSKLFSKDKKSVLDNCCVMGGRFAGEASGLYSQVTRSSGSPGSEASWNVTQLEARGRYRLFGPAAVEISLGRRFLSPDADGEAVGYVGAGVRADLPMTRRARVWGRVAYLPVARFSGTGSSGIAAEVELGFEIRLVGRLGAAGRYTYQRIDRRLSGGGTSVTSRIEQDTARIGVTYRLRGED